MGKIFKKHKKLWTPLFYVLIGLASSSFLVFVLYWSLTLNSSITALIENTAVEPLYLWSYALLTLGTIILFGINVPLFVYRWRKFGPPKFKLHSGTGLGTLFGVLASACPVCGSTLLSVIGIAGGLATFPLQGLELKALSFGLMALPVWLTTRELKSFKNCKGESCPVPRNGSFEKKDTPYFLFSLLVFVAFSLISFDMLSQEPVMASFLSNGTVGSSASSTGNKLYDEAVLKVLPESGFQSKIYLGDAVTKLVKEGVIDKEKFEALYGDRGGLPKELSDVLTKPAKKRIILTQENSQVYVNLLWALGLSNYMSTNKESPVVGPSLFNFASTGGWTLGKEQNGGAYFNKFKIVPLTSKQEELVTKIAKNTYRPCCNNSTFFQDCNHGSALLGLLQLGASQGLSEKQLYRESLAFNSFWFPDTYIKTALYFKILKKTDWQNVDPKEVMGQDYSSIGGWIKNVQSEIAKIPNLIPKPKGGGSCGT
ncbi:MAG: hypothetical protein HYY87_00160 [Candidatus Levybacteria bacterium]|nr:hypothetical protein [Candidatus Levybacteria bacterium]